MKKTDMNIKLLAAAIALTICLVGCNNKASNQQGEEENDSTSLTIALIDELNNGKATIYDMRGEDAYRFNLHNEIAVGAISDSERETSLLGKMELNHKWLCADFVTLSSKFGKIIPYVEVEKTVKYGKDIFEKDVTILKGQKETKSEFLYTIAFRGDYKIGDLEVYQPIWHNGTEESEAVKTVAKIKKAFAENTFKQPSGFNSSNLILKSFGSFENLEKNIEFALFGSDNNDLMAENLSNTILYIIENDTVRYSIQGIACNLFAYRLKDKKILHLESNLYSANLTVLFDLDKGFDTPLFYLARSSE